MIENREFIKEKIPKLYKLYFKTNLSALKVHKIWVGVLFEERYVVVRGLSSS